MRKSLFLAAGLAVIGLTGIAQAQPVPGTPPAPQAAPTPPPPPGPPGGPPGGPMGGPGMGGPGMERHGMGGPGWGGPRGPMGFHQGPRGASFHFERGDSELRIRCAENESTRACVDAAIALLDKLGSMSGR
ncbi:hypothetical protein [Muricoccus radiodurans]|uniref:hypothetical protein n=1 Tax=Muricoccus radiodurans TaxID=2231721 RepID=UPI003CE9F9C0